MPETCPPNGTNGFKDDFNDGTIGPAWDTTLYGVTVAEVGGELVFDMNLDPAGTFGKVQTMASYDLTACRAVVRVTGVPDPLGYAALVLYLASDNTSYLEIIESDAELTFKYWLTGNSHVLATIPYDAALHAWWRLRESGGAVYWETSADGKVFTSHATLMPPPFPVTELQLSLTTGAGASMTPPAGGGHFDDLNLPPP